MTSQNVETAFIDIVNRIYEEHGQAKHEASHAQGLRKGEPLDISKGRKT